MPCHPSWQLCRALIDAVTRILMDILNKELLVDGVNADNVNIFNLLSLFTTPDDFESGIVPIRLTDVEKHCNATPTALQQLCSSKYGSSSNSSCFYCSAYRAIKVDQVHKVLERMVNSEETDPLFNIFPRYLPCGLKTNVNITSCWKKTLTEHGICFSPKQMGEDDGYVERVGHFSLDYTGTHGKIVSNGQDRDIVFPLNVENHIGSGIQVPSRALEQAIFAVYPAGSFASSELISKSFVEKSQFVTNTRLIITVDKVTRITDSLKAMSAKKRGCLLPQERKLEFFPQYSEVIGQL